MGQGELLYIHAKKVTPLKRRSTVQSEKDIDDNVRKFNKCGIIFIASVFRGNLKKAICELVSFERNQSQSLPVGLNLPRHFWRNKKEPNSNKKKATMDWRFRSFHFRGSLLLINTK